MSKIFIIIFWFVIFIAIFVWENRSFILQYFKNNSALEKYNSQDFQAAEKIFSWALSKDPDEIITFNLANTFLQQALEEKNWEEKILQLEKSIATYKQAQEINNKNFIENNLIIAEELLKNYRKKQKPEQNNQENSWENNDTQDQNWDAEEDSQQQDDENQQNAWENNQTSPWENWETSEQFNSLSNQQTEEIEKYLEELKQIEKNNQQFFNKQQNEEDFFEKFSNDPFLQDEFNRWWEKDW